MIPLVQYTNETIISISYIWFIFFFYKFLYYDEIIKRKKKHIEYLFFFYNKIQLAKSAASLAFKSFRSIFPDGAFGISSMKNTRFNRL